MRRYYVSPAVLGVDPETGATTVQVKATTYPGLNFTIKTAVNADGTLRFQWALVQAAGPDHTALVADPALIPLPDLSLDASWNALSTQQRSQLRTRLAAAGLDPGARAGSTPWRTILNELGQKIVPNFDCNRFDAREPA